MGRTRLCATAIALEAAWTRCATHSSTELEVAIGLHDLLARERSGDQRRGIEAEAIGEDRLREQRTDDEALADAMGHGVIAGRVSAF